VTQAVLTLADFNDLQDVERQVGSQLLLQCGVRHLGFSHDGLETIPLSPFGGRSLEV
jgi:hypothetical protein